MKRSNYFSNGDAKRYQEWIDINELSMQTTKPITDKMAETIDHLCSSAKDMKSELNRLKEENKPEEETAEIDRNIVAIEEALARMRSNPFVSPAAKELNDTANQMTQELECLNDAMTIDAAMAEGRDVVFCKDEFHEKRTGYILEAKPICHSPARADLIGNRWRERFHESYTLCDENSTNETKILIGNQQKNSGQEFYKFKKTIK